jgi:hypothetical protein
VITDAELIPVDMWAVGLSWSREALDEIGSGARYGFVTAHLFGRSGSWGVARDDVVRDRFLRYAAEEIA